MESVFDWNKAFSFNLNESRQYDLGSTSLIITRKTGRWLIDHRNPQNDELLKNRPTKRVFASDSDKLLFEPVLPDFPIVLKPDQDIFILANQKLTLYIPVPVWIKIYAGERKPEKFLAEVPSAQLSSIWFGEPQAGEKAYSFRYDESFLDPCIPGKWEVCCAAEIQNNSNQLLTLHRCALRVVHLSVYKTSKGLFSNNTQLKFKGEENASDVVYQKKMGDKEAIKLSDPREIVPTNILTKSFSFATKIPLLS